MNTDQLLARDRILQMLAGFNGTWVLVVGRQAGLLSAISESEGPVSEESLALALQLHLPYVRVWCHAAFAFGFLDFAPASGYRLAAHMRELLLDPGDPLYLGGRAEFYAATSEDFLVFPDRLRDGRPFPRSEHHPRLLRSLAEMTKPDFTNLTERVIPRCPGLEERLEAEDASLLDVGCGAGWGLIHFARRYPRLRLLGLEPEPESLRLARQAVSREGLAARIRVEPIDARTIDYREGYDLVLLNVSLHETGQEAAWREVLSRCRTALRPEGFILVSELPYPATVEEYRTLGNQLLAGVQHHEVLAGCSAITVPQLREILEAAGFSEVRAIEQPNPARIVYAGIRSA